MLSVASMQAALTFYVQGLGGTRVYQFQPEGEPAFLTLAFGNSEVGLGVLGTTPLHGQSLRPASGHRIELCINVDDVDATVTELVGLGAKVRLSPADQPWGERAAYVEDPDGNLIMLVAPAKAK
jgi:lactoylglutathione lyase